MIDSLRRTRNLFLIFGVVIMLACGGLGVLMNYEFQQPTESRFGSAYRSIAPTATTTALAAGPTETINPKLGRVDPSKLPFPPICGKGDRYGVVCKDGTVRKGYDAYGCTNHGGLDYWLVCP